VGTHLVVAVVVVVVVEMEGQGEEAEVVEAMVQKMAEVVPMNHVVADLNHCKACCMVDSGGTCQEEHLDVLGRVHSGAYRMAYSEVEGVGEAEAHCHRIHFERI
jgi:hypothetical protein